MILLNACWPQRTKWHYYVFVEALGHYQIIYTVIVQVFPKVNCVIEIYIVIESAIIDSPTLNYMLMQKLVYKTAQDCKL